MKTIHWALIALLIAQSPCFAQTAKKIPVAVSHTGHDEVGRAVALSLKEAIRGSQSFILVEHEPLLPPAARIRVNLVSTDNSLGEGLSSAIAIIFLYDSPVAPGNGIYITTSVMHCARDRVESCAKRTLPEIDQAVAYLRKSIPSLWKNL
jgi:hypothetical protein